MFRGKKSSQRKATPEPPPEQIPTAPYTIDGAHGEFGCQETNPIPAKGQKGSVDYLSRLQCKCGEGFYFQRLGSGGQCPDGHTVDIYELQCFSSCTHRHLFVDMYHQKSTSLVPDGLTLLDYPIGAGSPYCIQGFPGFLVNQRPEKKADITENSDEYIIKAILAALDEAESQFKEQSSAFSRIREHINSGLKSHRNEVTQIIRNAKKPSKAWVYSKLCNMAGDYAASGQHHIYRGALDPIGQSFLKIHDETMDELVKMGEADKEFAEDQKSILREQIASVG